MVFLATQENSLESEFTQKRTSLFSESTLRLQISNEDLNSDIMELKSTQEGTSLFTEPTLSLGLPENSSLKLGIENIPSKTLLNEQDFTSQNLDLTAPFSNHKVLSDGNKKQDEKVNGAKCEKQTKSVTQKAASSIFIDSAVLCLSLIHI